MNINGKNEKIVLAIDDKKIFSQEQKLAYSSPVLQAYGSVGTLTQGGGSVGSDKAFKVKN